MSRRRLLGMAGLGAAAGTVGFGGGIAYAETADLTAEEQTVEFFGSHQAGIVTPAQDRLHFAAFDVLTTDRAELIDLLQRWTEAGAQLTRGIPVALDGRQPLSAPAPDTGEALGLSAARLTITFGFGPSLFRSVEGKDRFGIADHQPAELKPLPHFPADALDPRRSDGDLCIQACADDPQVAVHAIRNLARIAFGVAAIRWTQLGFGRTSSTSTTQRTPRNLFGFKDGTANLKAEDPSLVDEFVWAAADEDPAASWLAGGSYLVVRRISMSIETWDRTPLLEQQTLIGRDRPEGAPLSGGTEFTEPDFEALDKAGEPSLALNSHVRLAHPSQNKGARMLRRGYNFTDGDDGLGRMDAGLFFLAYVRTPSTQYVPLQNRLSRDDGLMEYLKHTGSALFAVPPGVQQGGWIGEPLFR